MTLSPMAAKRAASAAEISASDRAYSGLMERCWRIEALCVDLYQGGGYYARALPQLIEIGREMEAACNAEDEDL